MRLQIVQTEPMAPRLDVVLYGPAAVKQYSIFRELELIPPRSRSTTELEDRLGLALLESACQTADGSYLLGIAMDFPGFDWKPDLAGVALVTRGHGRRAAGAARRALRSCLGRRPALHGGQPAASSTAPPGFDDLIIAAGHVFGNGAGPTTGRLVADLICGDRADAST